MEFSEIKSICAQFDLEGYPVSVQTLEDGNINRTYRVEYSTGVAYLLQRINTHVFRNPTELMKNILSVTQFLGDKIEREGGDKSRETLTAIPAEHGWFFRDFEGGCWRMYLYIHDTTAYNSAEREGLLYEVGRAFGIFQQRLSDYPMECLTETIPNFHNTAKRYEAYLLAKEKDVVGRVSTVRAELEALEAYADRVSLIVDALEKGEIPYRVTHNDTKLNNIMVDNQTGKGLCVIDLDTVMPGSLLYDFGDGVRFAANNAAEDEEDVSLVYLRLDRYEEYLRGFLEGVGDSITEKELELIPLSVFLMTYEVALRFMTDYLDGDGYFKILYRKHNLVRARAQIRLMQDVDAKLGQMAEILQKYKV